MSLGVWSDWFISDWSQNSLRMRSGSYRVLAAGTRRAEKLLQFQMLKLVYDFKADKFFLSIISFLNNDLLWCVLIKYNGFINKEKLNYLLL